MGPRLLREPLPQGGEAAPDRAAVCGLPEAPVREQTHSTLTWRFPGDDGGEMPARAPGGGGARAEKQQDDESGVAALSRGRHAASAEALLHLPAVCVGAASRAVTFRDPGGAESGLTLRCGTRQASSLQWQR